MPLWLRGGGDVRTTACKLDVTMQNATTHKRTNERTHQHINTPQKPATLLFDVNFDLQFFVLLSLFAFATERVLSHENRTIVNIA